MQCKKCKINKICLLSDFKKNHSDVADIDITNCVHYLEETCNGTISTDKRSSAMQVRRVDLGKLNELSKKNDSDKKEKQKSMNKNKRKPKQIKAAPLKLDSECKTCGASTYKDDKALCEKCNVEVCSVCATYDAEGEQLLCTKCWQEL